jgi:hypothetical protein
VLLVVRVLHRAAAPFGERGGEAHHGGADGAAVAIVLDMIASGEIHLAAVNLLAAHLTEQNHVELLGRARHRSKREVEKLVAEIAPRPDVRSRVVALPRRSVAATVVEPAAASRAATVVEPAAASRAATVVEPAAASRAATALEVHAPGRAAALVAPLSPRRYQTRITVDEETHSTLLRLQDLLSHQVPDRDPAVIISRALDLLLDRTLRRSPR